MDESARALRQRLSAVPRLRVELTAIDRERAVAQQKYNELAVKHAQATVAVATVKSTMPSVRVVGLAAPPSSKAWPKPKLLYPAALVVGLGLGVFAAFLVSWIHGRVGRNDLETHRPGVRVFGRIAVDTSSPPLEIVRHRSAGRS
jgi:uncharacterized protein involved in exopolysaccharide biosynthesis